ncbi:MAG: ATP F0F1 synthase subunit B [Paracoccaceae bacterium]
MKRIASLLLLAATPAFAAEGEPFFSLRSTEFVVSLGFLIFIGIVIYLKVPPMLAGMLDKRAAGIKADLDAARALRDEANAVLAGYEAKHREMKEQAALIVETARREATAAAEQAKADLKTAIARRLASAEDQIVSAEKAAVKEVRDRAVTVAVAAAGDVIAKTMSAGDRAKLLEDAIGSVAARLN